jgi:hypothetical protein
MKTKITLLIVLVSFSLTSCVKDYIGHGPKKIKLTAENNMYEGDLYKTYLDTEILIVDGQIAELNEIIGNGQGTEQTQKNLDAANAHRDMLKQESSFTLLPDYLFRRIPRPQPPCPNPQNCDFLGFDFITSLTGTQLESILITDANGTEIGGTTGNQNSLRGTGGRAVADDFKIDSQYTGAIFVKVVTSDKERMTDTYTFESFIQ